MSLNTTCGNGTASCLTPDPSTGLAVGLTLLFLVLGISVGLAVYTQRSKLRNMLHVGRGRSNIKEDHTQTPQDPHQYTSMIRAQSVQTPIYENLTVQTTGHNRTVVDMGRSPSEHQEDLYLACEPDDAIYSNDPACSLAILPDTQEEDLYIVPDAL